MSPSYRVSALLSALTLSCTYIAYQAGAIEWPERLLSPTRASSRVPAVTSAKGPAVHEFGNESTITLRSESGSISLTPPSRAAQSAPNLRQEDAPRAMMSGSKSGPIGLPFTGREGRLDLSQGKTLDLPPPSATPAPQPASPEFGRSEKAGQ